jgi:hypothetical protein
VTAEPAPRRHRRRERRRSRSAGTKPPPAGDGGTPGEYAAPGTGAPVGEQAPGGVRGGEHAPGGGARGGEPAPAGRAAAGGPPGGKVRPRRPWRRPAERTEPVAPDTGEPGDSGEPAEAGGPGGAGKGKARPARRPDLERGLRGIVGSGPSQVGVLGAMRARDAARPTAEDLAAAEQELVIVRRHYVPPDADPRSG